MFHGFPTGGSCIAPKKGPKWMQWALSGNAITKKCADFDAHYMRDRSGVPCGRQFDGKSSQGDLMRNIPGRVFSVMLMAGAAIPPGAGAAFAEEAGRAPYVTVFGGSNFAFDQTSTGANAAGAPRNVEIDFRKSLFNGSYLVGGAFGSDFLDGNWGSLRAEGEISYRSSRLDDFSFNGGNQNFQGKETVLAGLANLAYDTPYFNVLFGTKLNFSAGGGVGAGRIRYDVRYVGANTNQLGLQDSSTEFAWQIFVGSDWRVSKHWSLYSDIRYFRLSDPSVERRNLTTGVLDSTLQSEYSSLAATSGIRLRF